MAYRSKNVPKSISGFWGHFYFKTFLWNIQQRKFRLSPFKQHGVPFPLVVAEGDILTVDVLVASL